MADTRQSVSVRIGLDGGKKVADDLAKIGAQGVKALDGVGDAAGRMSSATSKTAAAVTAALNAQKAAETEAQKLRRAYAALGVTTEEQASRQREKVVAAYEAIKASGKATADELKRAGAAMQAELAKIDAKMGLGGDPETEATRTASALAALGVTADAEIAARRQAAQQAFDAIKSSGTATTTEIARAAAALAVQMEKLDQAAGIERTETAAEQAERAFRALGVTSEAAAEKQKAALKSAFEELKRSGLATVKDLERAGEALNRELAKIDAGLGDASRSTSGIDTLRGAFARLKTELAAVAATYSVFTVGRTALDAFSTFEQGLIGIGKTADLSGRELEQMGDDIKAIARETPETYENLMAIAQAAGQLGVKGRENIAKFTKTVAQMGSATNLSGEQAATTMARLLTVTGEPISNVDRLGAALVALGNSSAANEAEIASAAQRIAQAGAVFNLTAQDALGLGAAMSSMGVSAELGGSSVGRAMGALDDAIRGTEAARSQLARALELTGEQLQAEWATDPGSVFQRYIKHLSEVQKAGGNVTRELAAINLTGVENTQTIGSLASNYEVLAASLKTSAQGWADNTALMTEAEKAAKSYAAQMQLFRNVVTEVGIEIGEELAPVLLGLADDLKTFIDRAERTGELQAFAEGLGASLQAVAVGLGFVIRNLDVFAGILAVIAAYKSREFFGFLLDGLKGTVQHAGDAKRRLTEMAATQGLVRGLSNEVRGLATSARGLAVLRMSAGGLIAIIAGGYLASRTTAYDRALESTNETVKQAIKLQRELASATGEQAEALRKQQGEILKTQEAEVERLERALEAATKAELGGLSGVIAEAIGIDKLSADLADAIAGAFGANPLGGTTDEIRQALQVAKDGLEQVREISVDTDKQVAQSAAKAAEEQMKEVEQRLQAEQKRAETLAEIRTDLIREIELSRMSADERVRAEAADRALEKATKAAAEAKQDLTDEEREFIKALAERAAVASNAGQAVTEALSSMKEAHAETRKQFDRGLELRTDGIDRAAEQQRRAIDALEDYDRRTMASAQLVKRTEREKTAAVEGWARGATAAVRQHYGTAIALARSAGEDAAGLAREMLTELEGINKQREEQLRGTVDRLIEEEQRHRDAAVAAAEDAARRIKSIDASVRDLQLSLLSPEAQYKAREGDIKAKTAEAKAALAAGQYEEAKDLADEIAREAVENARSVDGSAKARKKAVQIAMAHAEQAKGLIREATDRITKAEKAAGDLAAKQAAAAGKQLSGVQAQIAAIQKANGAIATMQLAVDTTRAVQGIQAIHASLEALKRQAEAAAGSLAAVGSAQPAGGAPVAAGAPAVAPDDGAMGIVEATARLDGARQALAAATGTAVAQAQADVAAAQAAYDALAAGQMQVQAGMVATGQAVSVASQQVSASTQAAAASSVISMEQIQSSSAITAISMTGAFETAGASIVSAMTNASTGSQTALGQFVDWAKGALASVMSMIDSAIQAGKQLLGLGGGKSSGGAKVDGYADGGVIRGPGTGTSDSILTLMHTMAGPRMILTSNGEGILTAKALRHYGSGIVDLINNLKLPRFAEGGLVSLPMPAFDLPAFAGARSMPDFAGAGRESTTPVNLYIDGQKAGSFRAAGDPLADLTRAGRVRVAPPSRNAR